MTCRPGSGRCQAWLQEADCAPDHDLEDLERSFRASGRRWPANWSGPPGGAADALDADGTDLVTRVGSLLYNNRQLLKVRTACSSRSALLPQQADVDRYQSSLDNDMYKAMLRALRRPTAWSRLR